MRIHKALSAAGVLSRRRAEELIMQGKVTVNGHPARLGQDIDPARDQVAVEGRAVALGVRHRKRYIILYKPRGYVTTLSDELGRRCVVDLLEGVGERLYPVGRLDRDSEGLLLLTNDGDFANYIMHPRNHVSKTYRVTVEGAVTEEQAAQLSVGVEIGPEEVTQPAQVLVVEKSPQRSVLRITIQEGKNRQIRRMCEGVGLVVKRLKRSSIGPIKLSMLRPGQWRELTPAEVGMLRNATRQQPAAPAPKAAPRPVRARPVAGKKGR